MVYKFFNKKSSRSGVDASLGNKSAIEPNYQLENELHKQTLENLRSKTFIKLLETILGTLI